MVNPPSDTTGRGCRRVAERACPPKRRASGSASHSWYESGRRMDQTGCGTAPANLQRSPWHRSGRSRPKPSRLWEPVENARSVDHSDHSCGV